MPMDLLAEMIGRTLVVAPHPDDEILGCGGTIARLTDAGAETFVAVVTEGKPPAYPVEFVGRVQQEAREAHALLGVKETFWLGMPAAALTETAHSALNSTLYQIVARLRPKTLIIPFLGDIHVDHQLIFTSSLVAARPHHENYPELILAYETLSETNWNAPYLTPAFTPNVFIEISDQLERKLDAMRCFGSQVRAAPHERSIETLRALATLRGATVLKQAAEAFVLVRHVF
jgi:LmbE family N-acetylglucosaminyl deacetylase